MGSYVRDTLRDFCEETTLWCENQLTAISLVALTAEYALTSSAGEIVCVDHAEIDEVPIYPTSVDLLNREGADWRHLTATRPQNYFLPVKSDTIRLIYTPSEALASGLVVWVSLKPLTTATSVEDFLWNRFKYCIRDGTIARLLAMDKVPWANPDASGKYMADYAAARSNAKMTKITGRTHMHLTAPAEFFC